MSLVSILTNNLENRDTNIKYWPVKIDPVNDGSIAVISGECKLCHIVTFHHNDSWEGVPTLVIMVAKFADGICKCILSTENV